TRPVKDMAEAAVKAPSPSSVDPLFRSSSCSKPRCSRLFVPCAASERLFCEQLDYNLLFRWFPDMGIEDVAFNHSTFSKTTSGWWSTTSLGNPHGGDGAGSERRLTSDEQRALHRGRQPDRRLGIGEVVRTQGR